MTLELDGGPIILQRTVPVLDGDTRDTLADRILDEEHRAYPEAVRIVLEGDGKSSDDDLSGLLAGLQRDDGDLRRTVDSNRNVNRSYATADENRRAPARSQARKNWEATARYGADVPE